MSLIRRMTTRLVYRNAWMAVREDTIHHADGSAGLYGVVDKPDYALIMPRRAGRVHLVEQYRYPVGGRYWEFPQGSWSSEVPGATPADLARAELIEETGLRAQRMIYLGRIHVAYGYSSQGCHVFLAEGLTDGPPRPEPTESDMRRQWVDRAGWEELVGAGKITDAASLAAAALLALHDRGRPVPAIEPGDPFG